ncbi:MAG: HEPN domain-containing protein [Candidatus Eremiobacteraeota bacterium]|nr:HEPN domain-containing protein [Candidatus Eremiobacteraeota bacterium]
MQPDRQVLAAQWRATAAEDLRVAGLLATESPSAAAFHAQQAAEKALKAACVIAVDDSPRTHVITHLLDELSKNGRNIPDDVRDAGRVLDRYYAPTRYPDALGGIDPNRVYTATDAHAAVAFAEAVLAFSDKISAQK